MAWLSRVNFTSADVLSFTDLNNVGNDIRAWGGNVNGGGYVLSNVVLSAFDLSTCFNLPISTGVSGLGTGVATFLGTPSSANLAAVVTNETGTGALVFATSPTLVTPLLGTPTSGVLTNCTGLPVSTGVSGLGTNVAPFLSAPSSFYSPTPYNWSQTPGGSLIVGTNTITLTPVPIGVSGTNVGHRIYISGGTGTAEPVLITGGTAVSGGSTGTLTFTAVNAHTGAWTASSASFGLQEAINVAGAAGGGTVRLPAGVLTLNGTVTIAYSNITIVGNGGMCCNLGTTIKRTGNFGDSITIGSSSLQVNMINLSDFALFHELNYVSGNPGTITDRPTSGAHVRMWASHTVNISRMRFENLVQNVVLTGATYVTIQDSTFYGIWDSLAPSLQVTSASILVNQASSGVGAGLPTWIAFINNIFQGPLTGTPGYTGAGPRQHIEISAAEDLYIDGGSMEKANVNSILLKGTAPFYLANIRILNIKFDSAGEADIKFSSDGVSSAGDTTISYNTFNGQTVGTTAVLVSDFGSGIPAVVGLVMVGNTAEAHLKTPFMFLDGQGFTITGNSIRFYNIGNSYATAADSSAMYFGGRSDMALVTGNQIGGGQSYEAFGVGQNYCNFGISKLSQTNVRLLGNYLARFGAVGVAQQGDLLISNFTDTTNTYFLIGSNSGGSTEGVVVQDDRGFAGVNSGKTFVVRSRNDGLNDTGAIASFETQGGSTTTPLWVGINGRVGIGTATAAQKLTVDSGSVKVSKGYSYLFDDANVEIRVDDSPAWLAVANTMTLKTYSGAFVFQNSNGAASIMTVRADTSRVGIGTTAPNYKLEISTDSAGKPGVGGLWTVVSDERIKTDITPADLDRCYEIVKSVPLKHFGFAPGVYTDDQINDKHSLGWIAQDVQKVFAKAVSVKPFKLNTEIPDGTEEFTEQDFTLETVEKTETSIQVIDGKAVQVSKVVTSENKVLLFDTVDVVDEAGVAVMDGDKPLTYQMPRMVTKTRNKVRHDVIEDCLDLNGGQMIAALYGAVQAIMNKLEVLTARN